MILLNKIAVLGGSGMTGIKVVVEALSRGISVKVLLRPNSSLPEKEFPSNVELNNVEVIRGDATNLDDVRNTIKDTDGTVIILGTRNNLEPTTAMSEGVKNALIAMEEFGIKPISICLSSYIFWTPEKVPPIMTPIVDDHRRMLKEAERSSADWIAVCPPHLINHSRSQYLVKENGLPGVPKVSTVDLAFFLIEALSKPEYYKRKMGISSALSET